MRWARSRPVVVAAALVVGAAAGAVGTAVATGGGPLGASAASHAAARSAVAEASTGAGDMMGGQGMNMMGDRSGMTGGSVGSGAPVLIPAARVEAMAARAARSAQVRGATVTYRSSQVTLVALGAPGNRPGMYWQVDGVVNPTVTVPAGATVTVRFADGDPGHPHGFEVTAAAPPYPEMAMMAGDVAAPGALVMPVPAPQGSSWWSATTTFHAPPPGVYYYLCPVPGHARAGMWGKLIVR